MNKFYALIAVAAMAVGFASSAHAVETDIKVGVESKYMDRGTVLVDDVVGRAALRFNDMVVDNLFVDANIVTIDTAFNHFKLQSEFGVGYAIDAPVDVTFGIYHTMNSVRFDGDAVTEARAQASYDVTDSVTAFARTGQMIGKNALNDTYFAVGTDWAATDRLTLGALASGYHYRENIGSTRLNNVQVSAVYDMTNGFNVYGTFSDGGRDRFNAKMDNQFVAGVSYKF